MSCRYCERPGIATVCADCRLEEKVVRDATPDYRETLTRFCRTCTVDLTEAEARQPNCPYCGERP